MLLTKMDSDIIFVPPTTSNFNSKVPSQFKRSLISHLFSYCWSDRRLRVALFAFLIPNCSIPLFEPRNSNMLLSSVHHLLLSLLCVYMFPISRYRWKFSLQAFLLGIINGWAIALALSNGFEHPHLLTFCLYAYVFTLFHFSEFLMTALTNPESLRPDSFLLNHSPEYWIAAMGSWIEFWGRAWLFPSFYSPMVSIIGLLFCLIGESFRKLAMCHAAIGFTHQVAVRRHRDHKLCVDGVYALVRHPGYLGWFVWSIGTQLVLCNFICVQAYAFITYRFFENRIFEEERYLIEFFGQRYVAYQRCVPAGIPGIQGFQIPNLNTN